MCSSGDMAADTCRYTDFLSMPGALVKKQGIGQLHHYKGYGGPKLAVTIWNVPSDSQRQARGQCPPSRCTSPSHTDTSVLSTPAAVGFKCRVYGARLCSLLLCAMSNSSTLVGSRRMSSANMRV